MQKNAVKFGRNSLEKAIHYAENKPRRSYLRGAITGSLYGPYKVWRKRPRALTVVCDPNGWFFVTNDRTAREMARRPGWTRL